MRKKKFKWNPALDASPFDALEEHSPFDATDESPLDFTEEEAQLTDDGEPDVSPVEQFNSMPVAEDTPAKGENPVASIGATAPPAPTAKELARLNRFPPA